MSAEIAAPQVAIAETVAFKQREFRIEGYAAPDYERVVEAFKRNFREGREIGAACAAWIGDRCVVDLWGGYRTPHFTEAWSRDTLVLLMSTTKGLAAMAVAIAHSRGWLDFDAPVARYWPEFAQNGKGQITVRQLLAHEAGLCVFDAPLTLDLLGNQQALAELLARQVPAWTPGARHGYHAISLGLYQSALLQRVDPQGRTLGVFLKEEIADKLGTEIHVGLPEDIEESCWAEIVAERDLRATLKLPWAFLFSMFDRRSLPMRIAMMSPVQRLEELNTRPWLRVELPSINGMATPRDVARVYSEFATRGKRLGISSETLRALEAPEVPPTESVVDGFYCFDTAYSLGFCKPNSRWAFGKSQSAYGTPGAGGSQGFADPDVGLGFAYAPNRLAIGVFDDPRAAALREAVYRCLGQQAAP